MKLYVTYSERRSGGICGEEQYSRRSDTIIDFQLNSVSYQEPEDWYKEPFEIDCTEIPQIVYVVLVRYGSGDSFGQSYGHGQIEGVYLSEDEAQKIVESIRKETYTGYSPWIGYFNSLECVNYHPMMVRKYPIIT
jgi:hypothetical protein